VLILIWFFHWVIAACELVWRDGVFLLQNLV
jgi:hypothetical protein